ncbi:MAG: copper homeostasis protein CutC [Candidatus Cloacimonetes bacterium]|nr:copper homeostasis protein CutC [Candidatus Cloacimonadota bacterium]
MLLEVCVDSLESALIAQEAGADRIELCSALELGGLSPSAGLIRRVRAALDIDIHVLIRCRAGDFCYTDAEIETMLYDADYAKNCGVNGVVFGALNPDGSVDGYSLGLIRTASAPLPITFHRAFDFCNDPSFYIKYIKDYNVDRVLTSGTCATALEGVGWIQHLIESAPDGIKVMAGGGINSQNALELVEKSGVQELHFSATKYIDSLMRYRDTDFSLSLDGARDYLVRRADFAEIKRIRELFS